MTKAYMEAWQLYDKKLKKEEKSMAGKALPGLMTKEGEKKEEVLTSGAHRTPPKEYAEGGATKRKQYADPKNYKYPIDTDEHVRAAIGYFSKPKNAGVYSEEEQRSIWHRIRRAARRHGISTSPESGPPSVEKKKSLELLDDLLLKGKAYLGEVKFGPKGAYFHGEAARKLGIEGKKPGTVGDVSVKDEDVNRFTDMASRKMSGAKPPPIPKEVFNKPTEEKAMQGGVGSIGGGVVGVPNSLTPPGISKSLNSSAPIQKSPSFTFLDDTYRSATNVMTAINSKFAGQGGYPVHGEFLDQAYAPHINKAIPMFKSCGICGRTYMQKSENQDCPTCSMNKAIYCEKCGANLVKSRDGSLKCFLCS